MIAPMKGEFRRLQEMPPGKRLEYVFTYYKWRALLLVIVGCSVAYVLYGMLQPRPEVKILWLSDKYSLQAEFDVRDWVEGLEWDLNGDQRVSHTLTYIDFDRPYDELDSTAKTETTVLVAGQDYSFFMVNELAKEWMKANGILGTRGDIGLTGGDEKEYLAIPMTSLAGFSSQEKHVFEGVYLCVGSKPETDERHKRYEEQGRALRVLLQASAVLE